MKSSAVEEMKVLKEYVVGVRMGSMLSVERRRRGVDDDIKVGMQAWSNVAGSKRGEIENEGSKERQGYIERGCEEIGVTIRRVRTRSRGARMVAAMAVAATATPNEMSGLGLSIISSPPIPLAVVPINPGSGTFKMAQIALRNQHSVVLSRKL